MTGISNKNPKTSSANNEDKKKIYSLYSKSVKDVRVELKEIFYLHYLTAMTLYKRVWMISFESMKEKAPANKKTKFVNNHYLF